MLQVPFETRSYPALAKAKEDLDAFELDLIAEQRAKAKPVLRRFGAPSPLTTQVRQMFARISMECDGEEEAPSKPVADAGSDGAPPPAIRALELPGSFESRSLEYGTRHLLATSLSPTKTTMTPSSHFSTTFAARILVILACSCSTATVVLGLAGCTRRPSHSGCRPLRRSPWWNRGG